MRKTKERNEPRFCADSSHWCRKGHHTPSCHPPVVVVAWTLVATSQLLHWSVPEGPAFCQPYTTKLPSINPSTTLHLQSTYTLTCSTPFPIDFPTHPSFFFFFFSFDCWVRPVRKPWTGPDLTFCDERQAQKMSPTYLLTKRDFLPYLFFKRQARNCSIWMSNDSNSRESGCQSWQASQYTAASGVSKLPRQTIKGCFQKRKMRLLFPKHGGW